MNFSFIRLSIFQQLLPIKWQIDQYFSAIYYIWYIETEYDITVIYVI